MFLGIGIGWFLTYIRAFFKYKNKKKFDECIKERKELTGQKEQLEEKIKKLDEEIENLKNDLEKSYREIQEKNKYLAEDKVVIERLSEVKSLADQIGEILKEYDKQTIKKLLEMYNPEEDILEDDYNKEEQNTQKKIW